jgi:hypothetical protein
MRGRLLASRTGRQDGGGRLRHAVFPVYEWRYLASENFLRIHSVYLIIGCPECTLFSLDGSSSPVVSMSQFSCGIDALIGDSDCIMLR